MSLSSLGDQYPMYIGAFGVLVGAGLALRSPSIVGLAVLFFLFTHLLVLLYEEPRWPVALAIHTFAIKASVRRWF